MRRETRPNSKFTLTGRDTSSFRFLLNWCEIGPSNWFKSALTPTAPTSQLHLGLTATDQVNHQMVKLKICFLNGILQEEMLAAAHCLFCLKEGLF